MNTRLVWYSDPQMLTSFSKISFCSGIAGRSWRTWIREGVKEHLHLSPSLHSKQTTTVSRFVRRNKHRRAQRAHGRPGSSRWRPLQVFNHGDTVPAREGVPVLANAPSFGEDLKGHQWRQPGSSGVTDRLHLESVVSIMNLVCWRNKSFWDEFPWPNFKFYNKWHSLMTSRNYPHYLNPFFN